MIDEGLLHGMQLAVLLRQAFDRHDGLALGGGGQRQA